VRLPWAERLRTVPILVFVVLIFLLALREPEGTFEPPLLLLPALNLLFITGTCLLVAYLSARTYLAGGSLAALLLGAGMFAFGIGSVLSPAAMTLGMQNPGVMVHNVGALVAGICCLASAMLAARPQPREAAPPTRRMVLPFAYATVVVLLLGTAAGSMADWLPDFFVAGQGPTLLRQVVLGSAVATFVLAALLFRVLYSRAPSKFIDWYWTALVMIAVGLCGVLVPHPPGTAVGWAGRTAQYVGFIYMFFAVRSLSDASGPWAIPLDRLLRETQDRYRLLVELSPDAILVHSEGRYVFANPAAAALFGASVPEEIVGTHVLDFVHPDSRQVVYRRIEQGHAGQVTPLEEMRIIRLDGTFADVEATSTRVEFLGRAALQVVMHDVTARKRAEERDRTLREASALLTGSLEAGTVLRQLSRLLVESLADWVVVDVKDEDGAVRRVTAEHRDPAKQPLLDRVREDVTRDPNASAEVLRTGQPVLLRRVAPAIGPERMTSETHRAGLAPFDPRSVIAVPMKVGDRILGVFTCVRSEESLPFTGDDLGLLDLVAKRAALALENARLFEEVRDANRLKDQFLATLSHELRSPLSTILGWSQMLKDGKISGDLARRAVEAIDRSAQAQTRLINDVLDVSRIITGRMRLDVQRIDLAAVLDAAMEGVRPAAEAKTLELNVVVDARPALMSGDRDRLQQVFWNLLSNAVKFTPGGGRVEVRLRRREDGFEIAVADTGAGIDAQFLPYLFQRFAQADSSTTRRHGGLGLGLAIVRHLVEMHGGTVRADSAGAGEGATFTVTLPARAVVEPASRDSRQGSASLPAETASVAGVSVLVVDDQADALEMLGLVLEKAGAHVRVAASADQALDQLRTETPAVIISDIGMPGMDGYELMRQVRRRGVAAPAIALTAYGRPEDREAAFAAGFQLHVPKPVFPSELLAAVASLARADDAADGEIPA
jgi:PAS domain S-box-containing protein